MDGFGFRAAQRTTFSTRLELELFNCEDGAFSEPVRSTLRLTAVSHRAGFRGSFPTFTGIRRARNHASQERFVPRTKPDDEKRGLL